MTEVQCPKCLASIAAAATECAECGSIRFRWIVSGVPDPVSVPSENQSLRDLELRIRAALVENLELQRSGGFVCTNVGDDVGQSRMLQVVSSHAHQHRFRHPVGNPGLALELQFDDDPVFDQLKGMPAAGLFAISEGGDDVSDPFPTASIDFRTDVDTAAHVVAWIVVGLYGMSPAGPVPINTWAD